MIRIETEAAPRPGGHYSQAVVHGDLVFVSGQLPVGPSATSPPESIEAQTQQALRNLEAILVAAGSDLSHVLKTTIFVSDIGLWDRVNSVYAHFFGGHRPARSVVAVHELHHGLQIEIDAVAARIPGERPSGARAGGIERMNVEVENA